MLRLVTGRVNSGKTTFVQNIIKEKIALGEQKIFMIVPEQFSFESERRILTLLGEKDALKVEVCSFSRLAENILGDIHSVRSLDEAGRVALMSSALEETSDKLQVYGRFSRSIGVVSEMLKISDELKKCAVTPQMLEDASNKMQDGMLKKKLSDLSVIISAFDALVAQRFSDTRDDLTLLCDKLLDERSFDGLTVVIDGFRGFTQQEFDVISRIMVQSGETYITLCLDGIFAGEIDLTPFACVRDTDTSAEHRSRTSFELLHLKLCESGKSGLAVEIHLLLLCAGENVFHKRFGLAHRKLADNYAICRDLHILLGLES